LVSCKKTKQYKTVLLVNGKKITDFQTVKTHKLM